MLATLIVCYLRPEELKRMLKQIDYLHRRIYIFVDRAEHDKVRINNEVIDLANLQKHNLDISINVASENLGAARSLPAAIDWISRHEDKFIILEDDCHLNSEGFAYLEFFSSIISDKIPVI